MIHRGNWKLINEYLAYRFDIDHVNEKTISLEETWLKHWLEWANDKPFKNAPKIKPKFPVFLTQRGHYSNTYIHKVISTGKHFFEWIRKHDEVFKLSISEAWLDTLKPPRLEPEFKEHEAVTIEEMKLYTNAPAVSLRDQRIKAAVAFWFLTGIRIGAFCTLPIKAVNLDKLDIYQWPEWGIQTKNRKRATTSFFPVPDCPELFEIIKEWDSRIRTHLSEESLWFAHFSPFDGSLVESPENRSPHRHQRARKDLKDWCERNNLPYHSPHKFRHGIATYALMNAKTMPEYKAISQNLMHSSLAITDSIYAILSHEDMKNTLRGIGTNQDANLQEKLDQLIDLLAK